MIKKFEIKSHDGPGRIGKCDGEKTPKLFYKNDLKICPSEGSAYNIDKEIAQFNVRETLRTAKENVDKYDAAVIQGSKYIDLRIECMKELEEIHGKHNYSLYLLKHRSDERKRNKMEGL